MYLKNKVSKVIYNIYVVNTFMFCLLTIFLVDTRDLKTHILVISILLNVMFTLKYVLNKYTSPSFKNEWLE